MDFEWDARTEELRAEVRAFLSEHLTAELVEAVNASGVSHDPGFARALGERNWIMPDVARDGFEVLDTAAIHVLTEELIGSDAPVLGAMVSGMVAKVINAVGPEWMRTEIVPRVVRGETVIALGMTEPEAGSDVAAVQTRARAVDDGWVIDGQKMFTTNAHLCDYVYLLARTDPDSQRHRGLTTFLVPADAEGFEAQAVYTLSGERTNITFFDDMHLEDRWRIGDVGKGWHSLMLSLQDEHSAPFSPHLGRGLRAAEEWAVGAALDGGRPIDDPEVREGLAEVATTMEVAALLEQRCTAMERAGEVPVAEGPMSKLFGSEATVHGTEALCSLVGPDSLRSSPDPTAVAAGALEHLLRFSLGTTIYAGTSEVQRNIIAQFRCGLPR